VDGFGIKGHAVARLHVEHHDIQFIPHGVDSRDLLVHVLLSSIERFAERRRIE
jgi:hypothetical protein